MDEDMHGLGVLWNKGEHIVLSQSYMHPNQRHSNKGCVDINYVNYAKIYYMNSM